MTLLARPFALFLLTLLIVLPTATLAQEEAAYSESEIDQMLAPIALYPDVLLSQILMASTYPLEVVQAARWSRANPGLEGEAAVNAVAPEEWDPSVKALVAFPQVLMRMDEDLDWTQRLGDAFLFQEEEVMDRVQGLRQRAYDAGNLQGLEQVRVSREQEVIIIEPASPQVVYVPYYNPRMIYGSWGWPAHPPYYWAPPGGFQLGAGFYWSGGIRISPNFFFSTVHWPHRNVIIVQQYRPYYQTRYRSHRDYYAAWDHRHQWRHDPRHRRGLVYRDGRRGSEPPQQIGRPPQANRRDSILRGTPGRPQNDQQRRSVIQRDSAERRGPRQTERQTGPHAHQFEHPNARRDSADRRVPINPQAGQRQERPAMDQRRSIHRSPGVSQQRGSFRSEPQRGSSSVQSGRGQAGGRNDRPSAGSSSPGRQSILRGG